MIDICRENALRFSDAICRKHLSKNVPLPFYFDWSDHIAVRNQPDYDYHLNKTASDVVNLIKLFKPYFYPDHFRKWEDEWFRQSVAAAWIHDIGMLDDRKDHGITSASLLFGENDFGFDFDPISLADRIKIGMLCIRHNNAWPKVHAAMCMILRENGENQNRIDPYFEDEDTPLWPLDFSGKLISTADFLRYRGKELRNDIKNQFFLWAECGNCQTMYDRQREFCSTRNCGTSPESTAVVRHMFDQNGFSPQHAPGIQIYAKTEKGSCCRLDGEIPKR